MYRCAPLEALYRGQIQIEEYGHVFTVQEEWRKIVGRVGRVQEECRCRKHVGNMSIRKHVGNMSMRKHAGSMSMRKHVGSMSMRKHAGKQGRKNKYRKHVTPIPPQRLHHWRSRREEAEEDAAQL
tara:strand:+ start:449 stop:823 length:375 start_codon:yes stop_codon:yes gene_type:complete